MCPAHVQMIQMQAAEFQDLPVRHSGPSAAKGSIFQLCGIQMFQYPPLLMAQ